MNFVFGAGGFAREVDWLLHNLKAAGRPEFATTHFVDASSGPRVGETMKGCPVIGEDDFFSRFASSEANIFIAMSSTHVKKRIAERLQAHAGLRFPALLDPSVISDTRSGGLTLGAGSLVCASCVVEPDVRIEQFAHVNMGCTIGHETCIGAFSTVCPGVRVAGNVAIGEQVFIGSGAVILDGLRIAPGAIIGAGAVVTSEISEPGTYLGVPARRRESGT